MDTVTHAHPVRSRWPPSMSKVAPVIAVLVTRWTAGAGDVGGADDAADRRRGAKLRAALVDLVAGQRGRRRVGTACRDQVDPGGRDLQREALVMAGSAAVSAAK